MKTSRQNRNRVALVTGATGIVGRRLAEYLATQPGWRVIGLSRRAHKKKVNVQAIPFLQLDLTDRTACRTVVAKIDGVTHLFNGARFDHDTAKLESPHTNTEMLANLLDALAATKQPLTHVHLVQGTKYYGSHLGPFRTPAKETDPRSLQSNFYYKQEDLVITRQASEGWTWSACRPHAIVDLASVLARSMPVLIAVYATISKELGLPLCFPGTTDNYRAIYQFTEAGLLARAIEWMSTAKITENNSFNITNGDYIRWCNLWPAIASYFNMELGPIRTVRLAHVMADKGDVWQRIVKKHRLTKTAYEDAALWAYGDFVFNAGWDIMSSTNKARSFGFQQFIDTETMFFQMFDALRERRIIPLR